MKHSMTPAERVSDDKLLAKLIDYDSKVASLCGKNDCTCLCCLRVRFLRELAQRRSAEKQANACTCQRKESHKGGCPLGRTSLRIWYMRDNHTFAKLEPGDTESLVRQARAIFDGELGHYGVLFARWHPSDDIASEFDLHLRSEFPEKAVREWAQRIMRASPFEQEDV
jgi:hypothetical protein